MSALSVSLRSSALPNDSGQADDIESVFVFDNFLKKPHEVRALGLKAFYPPAEAKAYYPGRNSVDRFHIPGLTEHVSRIVGQPLEPAAHTPHGAFRVCIDGDVRRGGVHVDPCHWSCLIYLSLPESCQGGTDFFRHLGTGTTRTPVFPGEYERLGVTREHLQREVSPPRCFDPEVWDPIFHVPMKFNRMVLFRPWLWHDAGAGFGDGVENGRLIYLTFYMCTDQEWR